MALRQRGQEEFPGGVWGQVRPRAMLNMQVDISGLAAPPEGENLFSVAVPSDHRSSIAACALHISLHSLLSHHDSRHCSSM